MAEPASDSQPVPRAGAHDTNHDETARAAAAERDAEVQRLLGELSARQLALETQNAELRRLHRELAVTHSRYRQLFENGPVGYFVIDAAGVILAANGAATEMLGQREHVLRGCSLQVLLAHEHRQSFGECLEALNDDGARATCEAALLRHDGRRLPVQITLSSAIEAEGRVVHAALTDVSGHKRAEARLRLAHDSMQHLAYHDPLTDLPNRLLFNDRLEQAVLRARRRMGRLALLFLDVDRFKAINDSLGHAAGDRFLCELARRLRASVRRDDTVARIAGDEFTVVLENIERVDQVSDVAQKILDALSEPMTLDGRRVPVTASIGYAMFPDHGRSASELLKFADSAMFDSKQSGRNRVTGFVPRPAGEPAGGLGIETGLRQAVEGGAGFELHYQPQVHARSGAVAGFEALLRWQHPQRGLLLPGEFMSVAEESGLIGAIGDRVLMMACRQLAHWTEQGAETRVAVNVTGRQLTQPGFVTRLVDILTETGAPPAGLELELSESALAPDAHGVAGVLGDLRSRGVHIAIDDFGTGASSLASLRRLPISRLKIDASFVRKLPDSAEDRALARAIISMAHGLDIEVVASGVESGAQQQFLSSSGSDLLQGFHLGRPARADRVDTGALSRRLEPPAAGDARLD